MAASQQEHLGSPARQRKPQKMFASSGFCTCHIAILTDMLLMAGELLTASHLS